MPTSTTAPADAASGSIVGAVVIIVVIGLIALAGLVLVIRLELGRRALQNASPADIASAEQMERDRRNRRR